MRRELVYVAHPLSGDIAGNAARVRRWLRWLIDREPDVAFTCAWLPYVDVLDDAVPEHRARGLRDCLVTAERVNGIVLCGGVISSGMRQELQVVLAFGGWVADLTEFFEPPSGPEILGSPLVYGRSVWLGRPR